MKNPRTRAPNYGLKCSLPRANVILQSLFSSESPPRDTDSDSTTFLPFTPDYVFIFLTALAVQTSFFQFPVSFPWEVLQM